MFYDVVVIGGGINGVGTAQAVVSAGYSCLLIEKTALAAATSSCSSKLIHGGLRYLESFEFGLVRESLLERKLLLKNAPDLVTLKSFHIPVYKQSTRYPLTIKLGLTLYSILGGLNKENIFSSLPQQQWDSLEGLTQKGLKAVLRYFDAQTDDAELTRSVMQSAIKLGAEIECPAELISAQVNEHGCEVLMDSNGFQKTVQCSCIVNAAGPWVNHVIKRIESKQTPLAIDLVQGTHLVLNKPVSSCYYMESPIDQRAIFLLPYKKGSLLGTTESLFTKEPSEVKPLKNEEDYLLTSLSEYFPNNDLSITAKMAGLRVLPQASGNMFKRSRDTIFHTDDDKQPRLVSVYGGKLTVYRKTAEKVIQQLKKTLPAKKETADTKSLKLTPVD